MVVGEGKKFPSVLIVPQWDNIHHWCQLHDIEFTSIQDMVNNQRLFDRVWKEVDELTKDLGKWERPKKLILVQHEWSVETGELTPTLKLKRKVILKKYHDAIESLYVEAK